MARKIQAPNVPADALYCHHCKKWIAVRQFVISRGEPHCPDCNKKNFEALAILERASKQNFLNKDPLAKILNRKLSGR